MTAEDQNTDTKLGPCKYCARTDNHNGAKCNLIKAISYYGNGKIEKVEFFAPNDYMAPLAQPIWPMQPVSPLMPHFTPNPVIPNPYWVSNNVSYTFGSNTQELLNE
jgi:hypothetical protein